MNLQSERNLSTSFRKKTTFRTVESCEKATFCIDKDDFLYSNRRVANNFKEKTTFYTAGNGIDIIVHTSNNSDVYLHNVAYFKHFSYLCTKHQAL